MDIMMIFLKVLNMSIAASWVVLAVLVLRLILKKAPKWLNVALWALVAVRLACPFSFESVFSLIPSGETVPEEILYVEGEALHENVHLDVTEGNGVYKHTTVDVDASVDYVTHQEMMASIVWLGGMAVMGAYALISYLRLKKKVAASLQLSGEIYLCDYIGSPFILGILRPRIYLPSSMDPAAAAHVLAHERAHLKRKDHWWKPLGFALLTVHWFNPVMWLAYILLCRDIEMACDEKVIREMGVSDKKAYSEALLRCSVSRKMIAACPLAFGEVGVKQRVKSVLNYKKPGFWIIVVAVIALIVAAMCLLTDPVASAEDQRKFDLPGPNVADMDVQEILTNIRKFDGLEKNQNPYVNSYVNDVILRENFDLELVHIPYFYDRDGETYLSIAMFSDLAESCTLGGKYEWEEQNTRFLFEHYLNALKYLPQEQIQTMLPNTEHYKICFVEEGTPGSYDRVIRYSDRGVGATDGWLIHLEVIPTYHENGGFYDTGEEPIHLFYGDEPVDDRFILDAKILEISNKSYLVEPLPGSWELSSADKIWVPMELDADPMPQVGDILRITYDGFLMETYPAQIGEVFRMETVTGEYGTDLQSTSFVYRVDKNGNIINGAPNYSVVDNQVYFNDNLDKTGTYELTSEELAELMGLMAQSPEDAITAGAREEDYREYVVGMDLKCRDNNGDEWWVTLFYTDGGINLKFYRVLEDGTSVPLDITYHIRYEPLTEYVRSLCDRSRMESYINIGYPEETWVEYAHEDVSFRLYPLVGWEYEIVPYTDDSTPFGIRCQPNWVEKGSVFVSYWPGGFATCGTGLVTEEGVGFVRGYYDGSENWSFERYTDLPGDYVVLNELPEEWSRYGDTVISMLDFGGLAEAGMQSVSYTHADISITLNIWNGWEYEITEYDSATEQCGIRFRPKGEEGWLNLQWGEFNAPKENRTVQTKNFGTYGYIVEEGNYKGEPHWRYIHFKQDKANYTLWNEGADSWLEMPEYQEACQRILDSIRIG